MMQEEVGEEVHGLLVQRPDGRRPRSQRRRVAERTADRREQPTTPRNRRGAARRVWGRLRRGQESHEGGKLLDGAGGEGNVRAVPRRNAGGVWLRLTPRRPVPVRLDEIARARPRRGDRL